MFKYILLQNIEWEGLIHFIQPLLGDDHQAGPGSVITYIGCDVQC